MIDVEQFAVDENFYRAVKRSEPSVIRSDGKPSSALFKNQCSKNGIGISVDCKDGRNIDEVKSAMIQFFTPRLKAIFQFGINDVKNSKVTVLRSPSAVNQHHAEVYKNIAKEPLSNLQALMLAEACEKVYWNDGCEWTTNR